MLRRNTLSREEPSKDRCLKVVNPRLNVAIAKVAESLHAMTGECKFGGSSSCFDPP